MKVYRAAVIGLGNVGLLFSLDPKRKLTWSHCEAFRKWEGTSLSGAVEIDSEKRKAFRDRYPDLPVYQGIDALFADQDIEIVSICTPTETHLGVLQEILEHPVKAVFCEKPLASSISESRSFLDSAGRKGVVVALNHARRWNGCFLQAASLIGKGAIGKIKAVNAFYPGQVRNIGTHLFDTVRMLVRRDPLWVRGIFANSTEEGDPSVSGLIVFEGNMVCTVSATGRREDLIFEIDVIGEEGRVQVLENGSKLRLYQFRRSTNYSGYRELEEKKTERISPGDPFLDAVRDITDVLDGKKPHPECTATDGFWSLALAEALLESAQGGGTYRAVPTLAP